MRPEKDASPKLDLTLTAVGTSVVDMYVNDVLVRVVRLPCFEWFVSIGEFHLCEDVGRPETQEKAARLRCA